MVIQNTPSDEIVMAIRCQDIQTGLQGYSIGDFDTLLKVGMAARLAIHVRGGDVIDYTRLKQVSHHLFDIPTVAFNSIMNLLADIEFVRLVKVGETIKSILPNVPYFDDMYEVLGEKAKLEGMNEFEQASVTILNRLANSPVRKDELQRTLNIDDGLFRRVLSIGGEGSYLQQVVTSSHDTLLVSPLYFSENAELFAEAVSKYGETIVKSTIDLMKKYPGIPYEKVLQTSEIGEVRISPDEIAIIQSLAQNGIVQPPSITTTYSGKNHFLFTPPMGTPKITVVEKEIYEKAMAVVASLRQGEHFGQFKIKNPVAIIDALLDRGWLKATSVAREQYANLALRKICRLVSTGGDFYQPVFIDLPENRRALEHAKEMLTNPDIISSRGLDESARQTIFSPADYQEALRGYKEVRQKQHVNRTSEEHNQYINALLDMTQKGY